MTAPAPFGPQPSARQLAWHRMEMYGFIHFTVNTFTGLQWGYGDEDPSIFNPRKLDARQWVRVARDAGLSGLILTAKHHDGFCLWPSAFTEHSVKNAPWKDGKGDVVQEFYEACQEYGLRMGIYLSPWDRNHAEYGREGYVNYYRQQLQELLNRYPGELFEMWFDGANGGDGYYGGTRETRTIDRKHYYRMPELYDIVRDLQPDACIFSDAGPDIRWVGNEQGRASHTCWARINPEGIYLGDVDQPQRLGCGEADGSCYRPAEVDVSLRPSWFFDPKEQAHSLDELLEIYFSSIGCGCGLNLNLPPNPDGLIADEDVQRLREFRAALDALFAHDIAAGKPVTASNVRDNAPEFSANQLTDGDYHSYWATDDDVCEAALTVNFGQVQRVGTVRLEEYIELG
ncbi:MAG TPA: alpha-L-fucosidase, partial [Armatimonadota bacterium]|nr:alpha-L-fucosidase [Armatimonadota bacterium]